MSEQHKNDPKVEEPTKSETATLGTMVETAVGGAKKIVTAPAATVSRRPRWWLIITILVLWAVPYSISRWAMPWDNGKMLGVMNTQFTGEGYSKLWREPWMTVSSWRNPTPRHTLLLPWPGLRYQMGSSGGVTYIRYCLPKIEWTPYSGWSADEIIKVSMIASGVALLLFWLGLGRALKGKPKAA